MRLGFFDILTLMFIGFQWADVTDFSWWWLAPLVVLAMLDEHAFKKGWRRRGGRG